MKHNTNVPSMEVLRYKIQLQVILSDYFIIFFNVKLKKGKGNFHIVVGSQ